MTDNLTPTQRSYAMSRMRSKDTSPERTIRTLIHARGLRYRKHSRRLPGRPDLVFSRAKVIVFVDGDFFHGWRFPRWKDRLPPYWQSKIAGNRKRDIRHSKWLRRQGWCVIRIWQHEIEKSAAACVDRIERIVRVRLKALLARVASADRIPNNAGRTLVTDNIALVSTTGRVAVVRGHRRED